MAAKEPLLICYRTACPNPAHPLGYNRITHGLYCLDCAHRMQHGPDREVNLFPLLQFDNRTDISGGSYAAGLVCIRPDIQLPKEVA